MTRWQAFIYMCGVLRAGLLQGPPPEKPDDIDWKLIISGSSVHRVLDVRSCGIPGGVESCWIRAGLGNKKRVGADAEIEQQKQADCAA